MQKTIQVEFIDVVTGETFARTDMQGEALPPVFNASTALRIGESLWSVVAADPERKEDILRIGRLRLVLRLQQLAEQVIRYSVPTMSALRPEWSSEVAEHGPVQSIDMDTWRQIELIDLRHRAVVEAELATVWEVHRAALFAPGFAEMHLRERPEQPLDGLEWSHLEPLLGPADVYDRLYTRSPDGERVLIERGFAARLPGGLRLYGRRDGDRVTELCIMDNREDEAFVNENPAPVDLGPLGPVILDWADSRDLMLVDWCACAVWLRDQVVDL